MHLAAIFLSLLVFATGVVLSRNSDYTKPTIDKTEEAVTEAPNVQTDTLDINSSDTTVISVTQTETPTPTPDSTNFATDNFENFRYPDSEIVSESDTEIKLQSEADSQNIVNWYKEQIKTKGFAIENFITTKTNGNELVKLTAADGSDSIYVEISKSVEENITTVIVNIE